MNRVGGVVIVGGGQAGLEAAAALRAHGYAGTVTLVCEEPHAPYQRPPLSKQFLLGKQHRDSLPLRAPAFYEKHRIDLLLGGRATEIQRSAKRVQLAGGGSLAYDRLILAMGARNRRLALPGAENALYLRTFEEAELLRQRLREAHSVAVIGGGFIGLEVAAAARKLDKTVTVIEAEPRLMARSVAPPISDFFLKLHHANGVAVQLNAFLEEAPAADVVVAGVGVVPNVELARDAGLAVANGIVVDEYLRTADPDIFAIGDCADHPNVFAGGRTRLESVQNAADQAKCVARTIAGEPSPYREVPWFWTDQYDVRFQMAGISARYEEYVVRGDIGAHKFSVFYFKDGKLLAVDSVNHFGDHVAARKMLAAGTALTPPQAADESVDLKKLVAAG